MNPPFIPTDSALPSRGLQNMCALLKAWPPSHLYDTIHPTHTCTIPHTLLTLQNLHPQCHHPCHITNTTQPTNATTMSCCLSTSLCPLRQSAVLNVGPGLLTSPCYLLLNETNVHQGCPASHCLSLSPAPPNITLLSPMLVHSASPCHLLLPNETNVTQHHPAGLSTSSVPLNPPANPWDAHASTQPHSLHLPLPASSTYIIVIRHTRQHTFLDHTQNPHLLPPL